MSSESVMSSDVISTLTSDNVSAKPQSSTLEAFYGVLDKLSHAGSTAKSEEATTESKQITFFTVLKYALVITLVCTILLLPGVQNVASKMFANTAVKILVQAIIVFTVALVLLNRCR